MNLLSRSRQGLSAGRINLLRGICYFFLAVGVAALGYVGFVSAGSKTYQAVEKEKFAQAIVIEQPHALLEGEVIGEIQVPRLGLDAMVVQGDSASNLQRAVGHISSSALPGEGGNVALAGHRDTFFRALHNVRQDDEITLMTLDGSYRYRVDSISVVGPEDTQVLDNSGGDILTLVTCYPFYFVGPAPRRFIVRAQRTSQ